MGLLEFFRKYRNKPHPSPSADTKPKPKVQQQQQQQIFNSSGMQPIDLNATV